MAVSDTEQQAVEQSPGAQAPGEREREPVEERQAGAGGPQGASDGEPWGSIEEPQGAPQEPQGIPAQGQDVEEQDARREQAALQVDVEELLQAAAKRDEYLALAQRTQADFENYRKRVAKEVALAQQRGVAKLARELLPALDNLDRALQSATEGDPLLDGVKLVRDELHGALARLGIESFSPQGERFDPAHHEAVAQQPVDGARSGDVAEVFQPGYRMGSEVIRPARVLVAA